MDYCYLTNVIRPYVPDNIVCTEAHHKCYAYKIQIGNITNIGRLLDLVLPRRD